MSFSLSHGKDLDPSGVGLAQEELPAMDQGPLDLAGWFGADRRGLPLELEIGSGKGTFLVQQAALTPRVNYVGLEYARQFWLYAADRCRRHGLGNVRLVRVEAGMFVRQYVPAGCLRQVHIYFPDPWPKTRHHKRRLIQAPFLRELWRVLAPVSASDAAAPTTAAPAAGVLAAAGGADVAGPRVPEPPVSPCIRLATDHSEYFAWMLAHAGQVADLFEALPFESPDSAGEGELVGTNFERKYRREGRPFHGVILRKRPGPPAP